jgi:hypothetical protein
VFHRARFLTPQLATHSRRCCAVKLFAVALCAAHVLTVCARRGAALRAG